jgi:hypothetical protein
VPGAPQRGGRRCDVQRLMAQLVGGDQQDAHAPPTLADARRLAHGPRAGSDTPGDARSVVILRATDARHAAPLFATRRPRPGAGPGDGGQNQHGLRVARRIGPG